MWLVVLALIPLDLGTPSPAAGRSDLAVQLTITGSRYRITHRYSGSAPRRFVTGAADKNCDQPVDVLLVDGERRALFSELPCGGFAFRAARELRPGETWTIEGSLDLKEGSHTVVARYCPTRESLKEVDPKVRAVDAPPWWLGCADSPPAHQSIKK